jgi:hypothetical protein
MNKYSHGNFSIEIYDDPTHLTGSADNTSNYRKYYFGNDAIQYPTSKHGIKIYVEEEEINSCIVIGSGGSTGVYQNSSVLNNEQLLICCCDTVFCLSIPELELNWMTQADQATCFSIFNLQGDYIVHGEITISRIDNKGNIKWQFGGSDIFVSFNSDEAFKLNADHIALTDFYNTRYKIDFNGKILYA